MRSSRIMRVTNRVSLEPNHESVADASTARIQETDVYYEQGVDGYWYRSTTNQTYRVDNDGTPTLVQIAREQLTGLATNVLSVTRVVDADTNTSTTTVTIDWAKKRTTTTTVSPWASQPAVSVAVNGLAQSASTFSVTAPTRYYYDGLGRLTSVTSPLGFSSSLVYNAASGLIESTNNAAAKTTRFEYYASGRLGAGLLKCQTDPNCKKTYCDYNGRDQLTRIWGDVPYPEERIYNDYGEQTQLKTYRGGTGWTSDTWPTSTTGTADTTTWAYQESTGLLLSKTDALGRATTRTYYLNGFLQTVTDARNVTATFQYNEFGDPTGMTYSDGTSNVVFESFNRAGSPRTITDGSGIHTLAYDHANRLTSDTGTAGWLNGMTLGNAYHPVWGKNRVTVQTPLTSFQQDYGYDAASGRISSAAQGAYNAQYTYLASSDLIQLTDCRKNSTSRLANAQMWELGYRLQNVTGTAGGQTLSGRAYVYDDVDRRVHATLADGSGWNYDYNDRNEVVSGKRSWVDFTPVSGQQFEYRYDTIGNRSTAASGGDVGGVNLRSKSYTVNALNQYTQVLTPGYQDVLGVAVATNAVTVNGGATDRKTEYFHRELPVNNNAVVWQGVSVVSAGTTSNANCVFPPYSAAPAYDLNGNLTNDGVWTYAWDGENRLKSAQLTSANIPVAARWRIELAYDYLGRRVQKVVKDGNGAVVSARKFIYGGWNLVAELDGSNNLIRSYLWGLDLSRTLSDSDTGAGGVGGLLLVSTASPASAGFPAYDGNGNVMALVDADNGGTLAQYEYGPFGEVIRMTGQMAKVNPFRWSTRYTDEESSLVYYGYRYYSPALGRWTNRDPIGEDGGNNLYAFAGNSPVNSLDPLGQFTFGEILVDLAAQYGDKSVEAARGASILKRLRDVVETMNSIESFKEGWMTASDMLDIDGTDMLLKLESFRGEQAQGFRGGRSLVRAEFENSRAMSGQGHHIFPQQFRDTFKAIIKGKKTGKFDIDSFGIFINESVHGRLHGGGFNNLWHSFLQKNGARIKRDPMFGVGFGLGIINELGFGNFALSGL